jgi:hypothetical protein
MPREELWRRKRCRRPSNDRLDAALESQVIEILRERYADFGLTLAAEKLTERRQIVLANERVRRIQIDAGLWIPRKLRPSHLAFASPYRYDTSKANGELLMYSFLVRKAPQPLYVQAAVILMIIVTFLLVLLPTMILTCLA